MSQEPTYEELKARVAELERRAARASNQSDTIIRQLSEDFKQLADRSQDAIYQFDIESRTFTFFNKCFLAWFASEENGEKILSPKTVLLHIHPDEKGSEKENQLSRLLMDNIKRMRRIIHKFQNVTRYVAKDYVAGKRIIDIEGASDGQAEGNGERSDEEIDL